MRRSKCAKILIQETAQETMSAVKSFKNNKAAGLNKIPAELLNFGEERRSSIDLAIDKADEPLLERQNIASQMVTGSHH